MTKGMRKGIALMAIAGVSYLVAAFVGGALSSENAFATLWPPNGVLVAILLRSDFALWPYVILATCPANLAFDAWYDRPLLLSLAYWMANVGTSVAAAGVVRRVHGRVALDRLVEIVTFVAATVACTTLGATIGAAATSAWHPGTSVTGAWWSWWTGDLLGILVVAPVVVTFPGARAGAERPQVSRECVAFAVALSATVLVDVSAPLLGLDPRLVVQPFAVPLLGWAVLRLGVAGTSWGLLVVSFLIILNHIRGLGEFVGPDGFTAERAAIIQAILSGLSVTFLSVAAAIEEKRRSEKRLVRRDESRKALVAAMSHEIRNPIGVILANVELADEPPAAEGAGLAPLRAIERAARQILEVVEDALHVSQAEAEPDSVRAEPVWLPALWRELYVDCQAMRRGQDVALHWKAPVPDVTLLIDRNRVTTMIRNLVGNALKFTDRGHVTVRCQVDDESVVFTVEDSGIGIPVEDQARIFSLHNRGANAEVRWRPGSGVGLYLVRQYAAQCGGTVSLHSVPQQGSTFTVTLPRAMAEARVA